MASFVLQEPLQNHRSDFKESDVELEMNMGVLTDWAALLLRVKALRAGKGLTLSLVLHIHRGSAAFCPGFRWSRPFSGWVLYTLRYLGEVVI